MRNVIKALEDYQKLRWTESGICIFGQRDAEKIRSNSGEGNAALIDALRAGYAIGYKQGKTIGAKDTKAEMLRFYGIDNGIDQREGKA